jgi:uncharacterized repeat protein (TIGR01451 family)
MKQIFITLFALSCLYLVLISKAVAQQYGPTYSQSILIDKMVSKPNQTHAYDNEYEYVDNLSSSDPRFQPAEEVYFKLKVKNTSTEKIYNVTVKDFVPNYLEPISGPGSYDVNSRVITINAGDFGADEEKYYYIKMKVFTQDKLPSDKGLFCITNKAEAKNDNLYDQDSAQLCIEKQVVGVPGTATIVTTTPQAGPEMGIALLGIETALIGLGFYLKKYN